MNTELERAQYLTAAMLAILANQSDSIFLVNSILSNFEHAPGPSSDIQNLSSPDEIERIFRHIEKLGYVYGYHDPYAEPRYQITPDGTKKVAEESKDRKSLIHRYKKFGKSWLVEVLYNISSPGPLSQRSGESASSGDHDGADPQSEAEPILELSGDEQTVADNEGIPIIAVPASDRIVALDHNSLDYVEALSALSKLSEEATKSNEFSALFADPEDRIVVLSQIDTGIQLLKNERVIPNVVKKVLQYPIHFIKENMPGAALGALASKAWDWVVKLLENLV